MKDELTDVIGETLVQVFLANEDRRMNLETSLPNWPINDYVAAPLCFADLYVAARRRLGAVSRGDVAQGLKGLTVWSGRGEVPHGNGACVFRLLRLANGLVIILRLGEHPNNGIMWVARSPNASTIRRQVSARTAWRKPRGVICRIRKRLRDPLKSIKALGADALDKAIESTVIGNARASNVCSHWELTLQVEKELLGASRTEDIERSRRLLNVIYGRLSSWSHRLLISSFQSIRGDVSAYDVLSLPSGRIMLMSWLDEGLYGTAAPLETHEESEVLQALSNDFLGWCDGDRWAGTDTVIFGKTLHDGKSYPVDDMEFWRELLGFPYVLDIE